MKLELRSENCNDRDDFRTGEIIFLEGSPADTIYIINFGKVGLFKTVKGRLVSTDSVEKGEFLGVNHLLSDDSREHTAIALESVNLVRIDKSQIKKVIDGCPSWVTDILKTIFERHDSSLRLLEEHNINDERVHKRVRLSREEEAQFHQSIENFKDGK